MALPGSGRISAADINVELGRAASAVFSINGAEERNLAGKVSGRIAFSDFHGKSSEIVVEVSSQGTSLVLDSLFTPTDWASETAKRVIIKADNEVGTSTDIAGAISVGSSWGGDLSLEVLGTVSGKGGEADGGVGGNAINVDALGTSGQKLGIVLESTGVIRAGGGGGGKGGEGGGGEYEEITDRDPPTGFLYHSANTRFSVPLFLYPPNLAWKGVTIDNSLPVTPTTGAVFGPYSSWFYEVGNAENKSSFSVARFKKTLQPSPGGAGGSGGVGQGYSQARADGSPGSPGGENAGSGGEGGRGGPWGGSGVSGSPGGNGNVDQGDPGASGGLSGYAITNPSNYTLTDNGGSLLGRT